MTAVFTERPWRIHLLRYDEVARIGKTWRKCAAPWLFSPARPWRTATAHQPPLSGSLAFLMTVIPKDERAARCRELRALALVYLGLQHPASVALAEAIADPAAGPRALALLDAVPALTPVAALRLCGADGTERQMTMGVPRATPIGVTTWPEEATRTPNSACIWVAEATIDGRRYAARSRHGAANELARQLVAARLADRPLSGWVMRVSRVPFWHARPRMVR
jgi:hypothetical protein